MTSAGGQKEVSPGLLAPSHFAKATTALAIARRSKTMVSDLSYAIAA